MKKHLKPYLIIIIFLFFCTGCNNENHNSFIHVPGEESSSKDEITRYKSGTVMIEEDSGKTGSTNRRFDLEDVKFGPREINFGAEENP